MPQFLFAGYLPVDYDPSSTDPAVIEEIHELNRQMIAAGVRKFAAGLGPAKTLRPGPEGDMVVTDGPYLEAKEQIGGLFIIETKTHEEAMEWARKGFTACRMPFEVREIFFQPAPEKD